MVLLRRGICCQLLITANHNAGVKCGLEVSTATGSLLDKSGAGEGAAGGVMAGANGEHLGIMLLVLCKGLVVTYMVPAACWAWLMVPSWVCGSLCPRRAPSFP